MSNRRRSGIRVYTRLGRGTGISTPIEELPPAGRGLVLANMIFSKGIFGFIFFIIALPFYALFWLGGAIAKAAINACMNRPKALPPTTGSSPKAEEKPRETQPEGESNYYVVLKKAPPENALAALGAAGDHVRNQIPTAEELAKNCPAIILRQLRKEEALKAQALLRAAGAEVELGSAT